MKHAAGMNIATGGIFVVAGDEVLALVALTEGDLIGECRDVDGGWNYRLEEGVTGKSSRTTRTRWAGEGSVFEGEG